MASQAIKLLSQPAPCRAPRSVVVALARLLDRLRLNRQAPDHYGDILRQGLAGDAAVLMQIN